MASSRKSARNAIPVLIASSRQLIADAVDFRLRRFFFLAPSESPPFDSFSDRPLSFVYVYIIHSYARIVNMI